ncbi:MAG TPA: hypothetical protein VMX16_06155 [Terriglobia bacterium]|nr:hypothetical protein [Terriglobia bacterium]
MMRVAVTGFGSLWRRRVDGSASGPRRFRNAAYFNTTGVMVNGRIVRHRKIAGHVRFNAAGGFNPNYPHRMIGKVFECDEPCVCNGQNKVFFRNLARAPATLDCFLVVARSCEFGWVDVAEPDWKSDDSFLISFSAWQDQQEAMLLMKPLSWLRSRVGKFVLVPDPARPGMACLELAS